jgi:hypothetical protein
MLRHHRPVRGGARRVKNVATTRVAAAAVLLIGGVLLLGCRHKTIASSSGGQRGGGTQAAIDLRAEPGTIYQVTLGDSTVLVDQATVRRTLRSVSSNGNTFVFDSTPDFARLRPGSVLLIHGAAMLKVLAVMPFEGKIALITVPAALTDAVRDAHIHFDHDVHFGAQSASAGGDRTPAYASLLPETATWRALWVRLRHGRVEQDSGPAPQPVGGQGCGSKDGWDYCVGGSAGGSQLQLNLSVKKQAAGYSAILSGDGHLDDFNTSSDVDIGGHDLKQFAWSTNKLNGIMNFSWHAGKDSPGPWTDEERIPLPTSFELPLALGDIPLTLSVTEALLIHPGFTGNGELSQGHFRIQFDGAQNFTFHGGNLDDHGNVSGTTEILETQGQSALGPHAFLTALAGPRIELKFEAASVMKSITQLLPSAMAERAATAFSQSAVGQSLLNTPVGQAIAGALGLAKQSVETVLKSNAAAHLDFILTASLVESGSASIVPCKQAIGSLTVKVGANATVFGQSQGSVEKTVFQHGIKAGTTQGFCNTDGAGPAPT